MKDDPFLTTLDAARLVGVSVDMVRYWDRTGKLVPDEKTASGLRLFRQSAVQRFAKERQAAKRQKQATVLAQQGRAATNQ